MKRWCVNELPKVCWKYFNDELQARASNGVMACVHQSDSIDPNTGLPCYEDITLYFKYSNDELNYIELDDDDYDEVSIVVERTLIHPNEHSHSATAPSQRRTKVTTSITYSRELKIGVYKVDRCYEELL